MQNRHYFFFSLKFIVLFCILLLALKKITNINKFYILVEFIFRLSIGLFIIVYFITHKNLNIDKHDRIIFIVSGFIIIILIDYIRVINILFNTHFIDPNCKLES
jgi:hypothetical protein